MAERQSVKQNEVWNNHNDQMDRLEKKYGIATTNKREQSIKKALLLFAERKAFCVIIFWIIGKNRGR